MDRKLAHERKIAKLESRRATKPIVEKRRRARINQYLVELKRLICQATNRDLSRSSKLEKADILEMTVGFLQSMQHRQLLSGVSADPRVLVKFHNGFVECAGEVQRYLSATDCVEPALRQRLVEHMQQCATSLGTTTANQQQLLLTSLAAQQQSSSSSSQDSHLVQDDEASSLATVGPPNSSLSSSLPSSGTFLQQFNTQYGMPLTNQPTQPNANGQHLQLSDEALASLLQLPQHLHVVSGSNQQPDLFMLTNNNGSNVVSHQPPPPQFAAANTHLLAASSLLSPSALGLFNVQRFYSSLRANNNHHGDSGSSAGGGAAERDSMVVTPTLSTSSSSSSSSSLRSSSEASSHTSETEMMRPTSSCRSSPPPPPLRPVVEQQSRPQQPMQRSSHNGSNNNTPTSASSVWRPW